MSTGEATATDTDTDSDTDPAARHGTDAEELAAEDTEDSPSGVTRRPTLLSRRLSLVAGVAVTLLGGLYALPGLVAGLAGVVVLWLATAEGNRRLVDLSGALLLAATVTAGTQAPVPVTLASTVGTVVAWDVGGNAIDVGEQIGREPDTTRAELSHALGTAGVGILLAGVSYAIFTLGGSGQPVGAVIALVIGTLALLSALRL